MVKAFRTYKKLSIPVKASIWFTICNIILKGISFITTPLFTRFLTSEEYGTLSVYLSYEQMIIILATWEIALTSYQRGIYRYKDNLGLFTSATLLFSNIITIAFFAVIAFIFPWFSSFTGFSASLVLSLFLYMFFQPAYSCWLVKKRSEFKYMKATLVTLINGIICVACPMAAILLVERTADINFLSRMLGSAFFFALFYRINVKKIIANKSLVKEYWKYIFYLQLPIVFHSLSYLVLAQADRVMISKMIGSSQAAYYSIAYSLGMIVSIVQSSINQALNPWRFEQLGRKNYEKIKNVTNLLLLGIGAMIILCVLVVPEIMRIMFTKEYYESIRCIPPIALSVYFMFVNTLFVQVENYYEKTKYVAIASVICAITNIGLNYVCIKIFGYVAAAYTTLVTYILFCLMHYFFMIKVCKESNVDVEIYDIKLIIIISFAISFSVFGISALYGYIVIRYLIFIILLVILFVNRKEILGLISELSSKKKGN